MGIALCACLFFMSCGSGYGVYHTVRKGETFDQICRMYKVDPQRAAKLNNLTDKSALAPGDALWIPGAAKSLSHPPPSHRSKKIAAVKTQKKPPAKTSFLWPIKGKLLSTYGKKANEIHDGIDISANRGAKIRASEAGHVIYSANVIKGYGNMVIIKHEGRYSTVYAHNEKNIVKKGVFVKRGAFIATVGSSGKIERPALHFEIRDGKRPVNPVSLLPRVN